MNSVGLSQKYRVVEFCGGGAVSKVVRFGCARASVSVWVKFMRNTLWWVRVGRGGRAYAWVRQVSRSLRLSSASGTQ